MSAPTEQQQIARLVRVCHDNLVTRGAGNPTLADVKREMFTVHGLELTESDIAECLNQTTADPDRGGPGRSSPVFSRHAQGQSALSATAHECSAAAAQASADAAERGDRTSHAKAAVTHADASRAHKAASRYHDRSENWHMQKAEGMNPEPIEAD